VVRDIVGYERSDVTVFCDDNVVYSLFVKCKRRVKHAFVILSTETDVVF